MNSKTVCLNCGKPMQYCECKFKLVDNYIFTYGRFDKLIEIANKLYPNRNITPVTEFEYFQQIGNE